MGKEVRERDRETRAEGALPPRLGRQFSVVCTEEAARIAEEVLEEARAKAKAAAQQKAKAKSAAMGKRAEQAKAMLMAARGETSAVKEGAEDEEDGNLYDEEDTSAAELTDAERTKMANDYGLDAFI